MKKKLSLLLIVIFALPIFALFGCEDVAYFSVETFTSSDSFGTVSGRGTFADGTSITLTATPKNNNSVSGQFVGWVYQNSKLISNDETYTIAEADEKSTLTFSISATTQGSYTAVFENKNQTQNTNMMYVKLDSYRLASAESFEQNQAGLSEDSDNIAVVSTTNLSISHGQSSNSLTTILTEENKQLKNNLIYKVEENNQVLKLNAQTSQQLLLTLNGRIGTSIYSKDLRSNISFKQTTQKNQTQNYASQVIYNVEGTYDIVFEFDINESSYVFVLTYKNLTKTA